MPMTYQLASRVARTRQSGTLHGVIESQFQQAQQVFAGDALHPLRAFERAAKLTFQDAIEPLHLLLLPQLHGIFRWLGPFFAVLPRRGGTPFEGTFIGETPIAL